MKRLAHAAAREQAVRQGRYRGSAPEVPGSAEELKEKQITISTTP